MDRIPEGVVELGQRSLVEDTERTLALVEPDPFTTCMRRLEELDAGAALARARDAEPKARALERALAPNPQWVEAEAAELPTGWRALADTVTDARIMGPAACGWLAGCLAAAAWNQSWERIVLTGAVVALASAAWGAVRAWRRTQGRSASLGHPDGQ